MVQGIKKLASRWWFGLVLTVIIAVISKIIRDIRLQDRFVTGIKRTNNYLKSWLHEQLLSGVVWFGFDTPDKLNNPDPESMWNVIIYGETDYDLPTDLIEFKPYLQKVYHLMATQGISFDEAVEKVKEDYAKSHHVWFKV